MKLPHSIRAFADRYRIDTAILTIFLLCAGAAFVFLKLASEVAEGEAYDIDHLVIRGLRSAADPGVPAGPAWLEAAMIDMTALGGWTVLTLVVLLSAGFLIALRKYSTAAFLVAASASGALLGMGLKMLFDRARPDVVTHLVTVHDASFPSGHAMHSAIIYLTLGALLAGAQRSRPVKIYLLSIAVALTLTIGFSRVYLGVHWPSDVVAGWSVGAAWALGCALLARLLRRQHALEPAGAPPQEIAPPESPLAGDGGR